MLEILTLAQVPNIELGHLLAFVACVGLAIVAPYFIRKSRALKHKEVVHKATHKSETVQGRVRDTADKALVDMLETGREISAQVDTKIRILNKLVKDADNQIARLNKILATAKQCDSLETIEAAAHEINVIEEAVRNIETSTQKQDEPKTESGRWKSDIHGRVYKMHEDGLTPLEIARAVRLSTAEVNLILHLIREDTTV